MTPTPTAQFLIDWIEQHKAEYIDIADQIWANPELAWREFKASRLQADLLEKEGFAIQWDIAGMQTGFIAEWGQGRPILGFIGEYDALPGLSQKLQPTQEAVEEGAPGHGCGHNLLGTGAVAAAVAVQKWLLAEGKPGTVRYYGCPAEELGGGKVYMARDGFFDDLDAALNFHPASENMASKGSAVGIKAPYFRFKGRTAHAGGAPEEGRSALDAVELMNVGANYLREHVTKDVRIHYIITDGGKAPNIVPETAEVFYYLRAARPETLDDLVARVMKIAEGAALMTETTFETRFEMGYAPLLSNHYLADLQYQAMQQVGPITYTAEEIAFAQTINDSFSGSNADYIQRGIDYLSPPPEVAALLEAHRDSPLLGINLPPVDEKIVGGGSTDVGDLSQLVPVSMLSTTCCPTGTPGHSWANTASSGSSIGHKGMLHAAKIMAIAAAELYSDPRHLEAIREEFEKATRNRKYVPVIPEGAKPPRYNP